MRSPVLALALTLCLGACSFFVDSAPAEREVEHFHSLLDQGKFERWYEETGAEFKEASKQEQFVPILEAVHRKLGDMQSAERTRTDTSTGTRGTFVVLSYRTTFSEGQADERFTFRIADKKPVLVGYNINSDLLITK